MCSNVRKTRVWILYAPPGGYYMHYTIFFHLPLSIWKQKTISKMVFFQKLEQNVTKYFRHHHHLTFARHS